MTLCRGDDTGCILLERHIDSFAETLELGEIIVEECIQGNMIQWRDRGLIEICMKWYGTLAL